MLKLEKIILICCSLQFLKTYGSLEWVEQENEDTKELLPIGYNAENNEENALVNLKPFYAAEYSQCENEAKECLTLKELVTNNIERYVNLFLIATNLKNYKVTNANESIKFNLEITLSGGDLQYLQNFYTHDKKKNLQIRFLKLDQIFSNIARFKNKSYADDIFKFDYWSFFFKILEFFTQQESFAVMFVCVFLFYIFVGRKQWLMIFLIMNTFILLESKNLYNKKIQEAEAKQYVEISKFKDFPAECDPLKLPWYHTIRDLFFENKCIEFYKAIHSKPTDEVFILDCIFERYGYYFVRFPVKLFGTLINDLTEGMLENIPFWLQAGAKVFFLPFIFIVVTFFILIGICKKRLQLSFFGASLNLGGQNTDHVEQYISIEDKVSSEGKNFIQKEKVNFPNLEAAENLSN